MAEENGLGVKTAAEPEGSADVPVTVVTGFLGAGKSTLVRRILTEEHGLKVLVVENEIGGDMGIEGAVVTEGVDSDVVTEFVELPNGCVCCTVKDDLTDALSRVVRARGFDLIVIETSGLADPGPVASLFWADDALDLGLRLDGMVCLVDAKNAHRSFDDPTFVKQVALADMTLINKVDLATEEQLGELEVRIEGLAPFAQRRRTAMAGCDLREALALRTLRDEGPCAALSGRIAGARELDRVKHERGVGPVTLRFDAGTSFDASLLDRQLGALVWEAPAGEVWRLKALVRVGRPHERWLYQGVHDLFEGRKLGPWEAPDEPSSFILIGKDLDAELLRREIQAAAVP